MLIDRFGDEYREYMKRTPRFIPKLSHEHPTPRKEECTEFVNWFFQWKREDNSVARTS